MRRSSRATDAEGEKVDTPAPETPAEGTEGQAATDEADVFRWLYRLVARRKEPLTTSYAISTTAYHTNVYDGLMMQNQDMEFVGRLAESWDVSEDGLEWTFHLRKGVKFHDGEDLTLTTSSPQLHHGLPSLTPSLRHGRCRIG